MRMVDFTAAHIEQAAQIAKQNYEVERGFVPALPSINAVPDLTPFADNGLGVAAFDGDTMLGFLCCYDSFDNAFGIPRVRGVFSPMGANGTLAENRAKIYARLYQAAGEKWARTGAVSHAVCLYAHDVEAQRQFFNYGFGLRCVDAIKPICSSSSVSFEEIAFLELSRTEAARITALLNASNEHMGKSPCFIVRPCFSETEIVDFVIEHDSRIFVAKYKNSIIAFIEIMAQGESFICDVPEMMNICGAYLLPEYRGKGIFDALLDHVEHILSQENYTRLGVDFESINPTAYGFWLKHFDAYTHSVVRRIDECAVASRSI